MTLLHTSGRGAVQHRTVTALFHMRMRTRIPIDISTAVSRVGCRSTKLEGEAYRVIVFFVLKTEKRSSRVKSSYVLYGSERTFVLFCEKVTALSKRTRTLGHYHTEPYTKRMRRRRQILTNRERGGYAS